MRIKMLQIGESGSGKTYNSLTFPKCYYLVTEPSGEDTILSRPELKKNLVKIADVRADKIADVKSNLDSIKRAGKIYGFIDEARKLVAEGKVETLVFDNFTYYADNIQILLEEFYPQISRSGNVDIQSMFGELGRRLYRFTLLELVNFPGNLVVNAHIKLESDENLEKLPTRDTPIIANISGNFRHKIEGLFSLVVYLGRGSKGEFLARTFRGANKNAKSRFPLDPVIQDLTYQKIMDSIQKASK